MAKTLRELLEEAAKARKSNEGKSFTQQVAEKKLSDRFSNLKEKSIAKMRHEASLNTIGGVRPKMDALDRQTMMDAAGKTVLSATKEDNPLWKILDEVLTGFERTGAAAARVATGRGNDLDVLMTAASLLPQARKLGELGNTSAAKRLAKLLGKTSYEKLGESTVAKGKTLLPTKLNLQPTAATSGSTFAGMTPEMQAEVDAFLNKALPNANAANPVPTTFSNQLPTPPDQIIFDPYQVSNTPTTVQQPSVLPPEPSIVQQLAQGVITQEEAYKQIIDAKGTKVFDKDEIALYNEAKKTIPAVAPSPLAKAASKAPITITPELEQKYEGLMKKKLKDLTTQEEKDMWYDAIVWKATQANPAAANVPPVLASMPAYNPTDFTQPLSLGEYQALGQRAFEHIPTADFTPEQIAKAHQEVLSEFNPNFKGAGSKEMGLAIRDKLAGQTESFTNPVKLDAQGMQLDEKNSFPMKKTYETLDKLKYNPDSLTPEEWNLVDAYSRGFDRSMNMAYRYPNPASLSNEFYQKYGERLNQGILKNKFPEETTVIRGVEDYDVDLLHPDTHVPTGVQKKRVDLGIGDVFKDEGFMSTTFNDFQSFGYPAASETIRIPGGSKQSLAYPNANSLAQFRNENEAILPKGLIRRVEELSTDPSKPRMITSILNPYNIAGLAGGAAILQEMRNRQQQEEVPKMQEGGTVMPRSNKRKSTFSTDPAYQGYNDVAEWDYLTNSLRNRLKVNNPTNYDAYTQAMKNRRDQAMSTTQNEAVPVDQRSYGRWFGDKEAENFPVPSLTDAQVQAEMANVQGYGSYQNPQQLFNRYRQLQNQFFGTTTSGNQRAQNNPVTGYNLNEMSPYRSGSWSDSRGNYYKPNIVNGEIQVDYDLGDKTPAGYAAGSSGVPSRDVRLSRGEFLVTPEGSNVKIGGEPGVDENEMNVPVGTKVFSTKIKFQGETMAKRAELRAKREKLITDILENDGQDMLSKNTLKRTLRQHKIQETNDLLYQDIASGKPSNPNLLPGSESPELQQPEGEMQGYQTGTRGVGGYTPYTGGVYDALGSRWNEFLPTPAPQVNLGPTSGYQTGGWYPGKGTTAPATTPTPMAAPSWPGINAGSINQELGTGDIDFQKELQGISTGDIQNELGMGKEEGGFDQSRMGNIAGMVGLGVNAIAPLIATIKGAKATEPVQNRWLGYGNEALTANTAAEDALNFSENEARINNQISRNTQGKSIMDSTRSLNVGRALRSMIDARGDQNEQAIGADFAGKRAGIIGERGRLQTEQDRMEMMGQTNADEANAQNIDNFYSNLNRDLGNLGSSVQQFGRNLNQEQYAKDMEVLLQDTSKYGIGYKRNKRGQLVQIVK